MYWTNVYPIQSKSEDTKSKNKSVLIVYTLKIRLETKESLKV